MQDERFEWDDAKAATNVRKHKVDFRSAQRVFDDPASFSRADIRRDYGEKRFIMTGVVDGRHVTVIYTERAGRFRLISARPSNVVERREYHERANKD